MLRITVTRQEPQSHLQPKAPAKVPGKLAANAGASAQPSGLHGESLEPVALRIEGRVTSETIAALRAACHEHASQTGALRLDVGGVVFADTDGAATLATLERDGAHLCGVRGFLAEVLRRHRHAIESAEPGASTAAHIQASATSATADGGAHDDAGLVARLRAGDDGAFEWVVRRYGSRLLSVARRMLHSDEEAQDVLQEAFLSVFRHVDTFAEGSQLSTWLHRIVVNAALMKLRSRRRRGEESIEELLPRFGDDGHWAEQPSAWRSDELLERKQTRAMMRRCIERLPERHREVLVLRDIEDLDTSEVAELLGISANVVKVRLHRARQALRTLVAGELGVA